MRKESAMAAIRLLQDANIKVKDIPAVLQVLKELAELAEIPAPQPQGVPNASPTPPSSNTEGDCDGAAVESESAEE